MHMLNMTQTHVNVGVPHFISHTVMIWGVIQMFALKMAQTQVNVLVSHLMKHIVIFRGE